MEKLTGIPNVVAGQRASLRAPMVADPGTVFSYGINTDWLGQVVEAVTGVGLDVAIKQGVTAPLGMDHTTFLMTDDQRLNCTPVHVRGEDGNWVSIGELDFPAEIPSCDPASTDTLALGPGYKWGYGLPLNTQDIPGMRRAWSGAWAGLCNTHFWVDRTAGVCASIYSNSLPFVTPGALALYQDFERALYAAL